MKWILKKLILSNLNKEIGWYLKPITIIQCWLNYLIPLDPNSNKNLHLFILSFSLLNARNISGRILWIKQKMVPANAELSTEQRGFVSYINNHPLHFLGLFPKSQILTFYPARHLGLITYTPYSLTPTPS